MYAAQRSTTRCDYADDAALRSGRLRIDVSGLLRRPIACAGKRPMLLAAPHAPCPRPTKARPLGDVYNICQSPETSCGSLYHVWTSEGGRAPSTTQPQPKPCTALALAQALHSRTSPHAQRPHARPPNRGFRVGRPHVHHMVCGCGTIAYTHGTVHRAELSTGLCCSAANSSDATPIPTRSPGCRHPRDTLASPHSPRLTPPIPERTPLPPGTHHVLLQALGFASLRLSLTLSRPSEETQGARACASSGPACIGAPRQPSCNEKAISY